MSDSTDDGDGGFEDLDGDYRPGEAIRTQNGGCYWVLRVMGRGPRATRYEVKNAEGEPRCVQLIHRHLLRVPAAVEQFAREARILAKRNHPNIIRAYGSDSTVDERPRALIEMELLAGYDARKLLARGPVSVGVALPVLIGIAEALAAVHAAGIVHQQLTLDRVFLHFDAGERRWTVKLTGFGSAREIAEVPMDDCIFEGVLEYAAPEQLNGARKFSPKTDLYSLGVIAFELISGKRPHWEAEQIDRQHDAEAVHSRAYAADPMASHHVLAKAQQESRRLSQVVTVQPALDDLVAALLEIDPSRRPADAASVGRELLAISAAMAIRPAIDADLLSHQPLN